MPGFVAKRSLSGAISEVEYPPAPCVRRRPRTFVDIIAAMSRRRNGSTTLLERLLEPVSRSLNVEAARKLMQLKADSKTQARLDELACKCNEGELTPAERDEYERYVTAGNLIAILQAKARLLLTKKT